jgi:hypothetical protein
MPEVLRFKALLFREGENRWIAQILEKDMAAHGPTEYAALAAVELVLQAHVNFDAKHQRVPLSRLKPAPKVYWDAYEHAEPLERPGVQLLPPKTNSRR